MSLFFSFFFFSFSLFFSVESQTVQIERLFCLVLSGTSPDGDEIPAGALGPAGETFALTEQGW